METDTMIRQLKYTANKHEHDTLRTFDTNITALCNDVIPKLELLEKYEQEEENGLLLRLPCKIGDAVYVLMKRGNATVDIVKGTVGNIYHQKGGAWWVEFCDLWLDVEFKDFGETAFLTREEAEAKPVEMEGGHE